MFLNNVSKLWDFSFLQNGQVISDFLSGIGLTLSIALFGVIIGIVIGVFLAIGKLIGNKPIRALCTIYINFVRGTPLLLQLYMFYYVPDFIFKELYDFTLFGANGVFGNNGSFYVGIIAVGLNSAAYVAEIFRGGILAIDKGQFEAARSLGFNYPKTLRLIILPQAIKNILPSLGNEYISVIKETAIVSVIGAKDLMFYGKQMQQITMNPFPGLFTAAIMYFVIVYTLTKLVNLWERKLQND